MSSEVTDREYEVGEAEPHRAFVREIHERLASVYAWGGTLVVFAVVGLIGGGWYRGWLARPLIWIGAVILGLSGLFIVRWLVYRRADQLWERVQGYCETNDVEPAQLREAFGDDPMYQFFDALFELRERRLERNGEVSHQKGDDEADEEAD